MAYFYTLASGGGWNNIDVVSKIGLCNGEYKVDVGCDL
jgi:hypothetical protein